MARKSGEIAVAQHDGGCEDEVARELIREHFKRLEDVENEISQTKKATASNTEKLGRIMPILDELSKMRPDLKRIVKLFNVAIGMMITKLFVDNVLPKLSQLWHVKYGG